MQLLLDTVALIYALQSPDRFSKRVSSMLRNPVNVLELSTVSLAEIAIKAAIGKLNISEDIARQAVSDLNIRVLPFAAEHAFRLFAIPLHHPDPFDRQIIAQALYEKIPVVTPDEKFCLYEGLKVIW